MGSQLEGSIRTLFAFAILLLVTACQTAPPEMTEAEVAQIEAEALEAIEMNFEGFRQRDLEMAMEPMASNISWSWGSRPLNYSQMREQTARTLDAFKTYEGDFTPIAVRVLTPDAVVVQFTYECTITYPDGRIIHYPDNVTQTNLLERTEDSWKVALGSQTAGASVRIDQVFGTYDFSRLDGNDLPNDTYSGGTLEWRTDGTWTVTISPADGSDPVVYNEGESTVGPGTEGCLAPTAWGYETPDQPFSSTFCDGLLTADDGTWVAHRRN